MTQDQNRVQNHVPNQAPQNDNTADNTAESAAAKAAFNRRSFIKLAGSAVAVGGAAAAGCTGKPAGGEGWMPTQYENVGNVLPQLRGRVPIDPHNPSIHRDDEKCILCGQCAEVCDKAEAVMHHYELPLIDDVPCIHCGQCTLWCPTGAITEHDDTRKLLAALENPDLHVVVQTAPSTRVGLGEEFGLPAGTNVERQQVAALRKLGFDAILDTNFAADLTIMEEAMELVQRLTKKKNAPIPQFTSCCPGWVKFCEMYYPHLRDNLSSARSPMGMLGPVIKTHYAEQKKLDPAKIVSVSIMPCTAKKFECSRPEMNNAGVHIGKPELRDTDFVITTRELARLIKMKGIDFAGLDKDAKYDSVLSDYSGGGAIFGCSGGVMEAAIRTGYYFATKQNPPAALLDWKPVRGLDGIKHADAEVPGVGTLKVAVVSGMANAKKLLDGKFDQYHFIEFMACPGGCISGGGQPKTAIPQSDEVRAARTGALYSLDERCTVRLCHENPEIKRIYAEFFKEPCGELSHHLLHARLPYDDRSIRFTAKK